VDVGVEGSEGVGTEVTPWTDGVTDGTLHCIHRLGEELDERRRE